MKQEKIRKVFLDELPKWTYGANKGKINWKESVGYKVHFIYDNIDGYIELIDYDKIGSYIKIKYKNIIYDIKSSGLINCVLGNVIGKHTKKFKYNINDVVTTKTGKIKIKELLRLTDRKNKWYKYKCLDCEYEGNISEDNLLKHKGCTCCNGKTVVKGINDIATTHPYLVEYFVNIEDAYKYSFGSNKKVFCKCSYCGFTKEMKISDLYKQGLGCSKCGVGISYPEKLMFNILEQLYVDFVTQLSKKNFQWCNNHRYDFYFKFNNEEYILETHGLQHYENCKGMYKDKLQEQQENDKLKKELALINGIKEKNYIVIDCRKSELEWIKQNVLNSRLNEIFDLSKIDWLKCEEFALSNLVKKACDLWESDIHSTSKIGEIIKYNSNTICSWLKQGTKLGWCNYNSKNEIIKNGMNNGAKNGKVMSKPVEIFKNEISLGTFDSVSELDRRSEDVFGIHLLFGGVAKVCQGKARQYKGFTFKYVNKLTK
ncbi:hypothetical protein FC831_10750 [Clostridium botulinum]|nr:hypothetical protein [Clostridium botulinum]